MFIKKKSIVILLLISLFSMFIGGCSSKRVVTTSSSNTTNEVTVKATSVNGELKIHYINVGQADSILIQQGQENMLIDAGNNADADMVTKYLKSQGVEKLNYVIGTHPHEDHIGGMDKVINTFNIGTIYMPKATSNTKTFKDVLTAIKAKNLKITTPVPGSSFNLGQAKCDILAPNGINYNDVNNYSVVVKITFGERKFLFEGDAEDVSEKEILAKGYDVSADVIKLGHHGSRTSSIPEYLAKVHPQMAVISCGTDNDYGHPHIQTMDKLKKNKIKVYRTDEDGTIVMTSDGKTIKCNAKEGSYSGMHK